MPTNTHGFFPCPFLSEKKTLEQVACSTTIQLIMISCGLTQLSSGAIRARQITDTDNEGQIDNHATEECTGYLSFMACDAGT